MRETSEELYLTLIYFSSHPAFNILCKKPCKILCKKIVRLSYKLWYDLYQIFHYTEKSHLFADIFIIMKTWSSMDRNEIIETYVTKYVSFRRISKTILFSLNFRSVSLQQSCVCYYCY